jgi:hypothetical protein
MLTDISVLDQFAAAPFPPSVPLTLHHGSRSQITGRTVLGEGRQERPALRSMPALGALLAMASSLQHTQRVRSDRCWGSQSHAPSSPRCVRARHRSDPRGADHRPSVQPTLLRQPSTHGPVPNGDQQQSWCGASPHMQEGPRLGAKPLYTSEWASSLSALQHGVRS